MFPLLDLLCLGGNGPSAHPGVRCEFFITCAKSRTKLGQANAIGVAHTKGIASGIAAISRRGKLRDQFATRPQKTPRLTTHPRSNRAISHIPCLPSRDVTRPTADRLVELGRMRGGQGNHCPHLQKSRILNIFCALGGKFQFYKGIRSLSFP